MHNFFLALLCIYLYILFPFYSPSFMYAVLVIFFKTYYCLETWVSFACRVLVRLHDERQL